MFCVCFLSHSHTHTNAHSHIDAWFRLAQRFFVCAAMSGRGKAFFLLGKLWGYTIRFRHEMQRTSTGRSETAFGRQKLDVTTVNVNPLQYVACNSTLERAKQTEREIESIEKWKSFSVFSFGLLCHSVFAVQISITDSNDKAPAFTRLTSQAEI